MLMQIVYSILFQASNKIKQQQQQQQQKFTKLIRIEQKK